jgi:hypothetical protein
LSRRARALLLGGLLAAAGLAGAGLMRRRAGGWLPVAAVERARGDLRRARVAAAGEPALAAAEAAGERLERDVAEARATPSLADGAVVERQARATAAAALVALASAARHSERRREALAARREELQAGIAALAAEVGTVSVDRGLRARVERLRLEADAAGAMAAAGDLAGAEAGIKGVAAELADAAARLDDRLARMRDPVLLGRWQGWVNEAIEATRRAGSRAVVVDKLGRRCLVVAAGRVVASYPAELGRNGLAEKVYAGDAATPEGRYHVVAKRDAGETLYHRALLLDYPTAEDWQAFAAARRAGRVPRGRGIGGLIEIHGHGGRWINWTSGCVALRDAHIDQLWAAVEVGTPVVIVGALRGPGLTGSAAVAAMDPGRPPGGGRR